MWKLGNRHLIGKSHVESGIENQDKCSVFEKDDAAIFIVSDGAGSARYGAQGAAAIVDQVSKGISNLEIKLFDDFADTISQIENAVKLAITKIHEQILQGVHKPKKAKLLRILGSIFGKEENSEEKLDNYSATLLVAVISDKNFWLGHIGDGYMVGGKLSKKNKFTQTICSVPENGEYENQTYFYTDKNWQEHLRMSSGKQKLDFFVSMTDGADPFLISSDRLNLDTNIVHKISELAFARREMSLSEILEKLFTKEKIHSVSNDDTTFCMLIRDKE